MYSYPATFLQGAAAATGVALINSIANVGGMIGPYLIGRLFCVDVRQEQHDAYRSLRLDWTRQDDQKSRSHASEYNHGVLPCHVHSLPDFVMCHWRGTLDTAPTVNVQVPSSIPRGTSAQL